MSIDTDEWLSNAAGGFSRINSRMTQPKDYVCD